MRPNLWNENWPLKREMSLCYPWASPWWHSPAPLLLPSAPAVHFSACHWGQLLRGSSGGVTAVGPAGTLAWWQDRVWGLQELSWQRSAFPAQEHAAGMDSFPLLPGLLLLELLGAELCRGAVLPRSSVCSWGPASSGKRWRRESKTGSVWNQSFLMLELPNSVFTHQGLTLMVIYSHFLVNN